MTRNFTSAAMKLKYFLRIKCFRRIFTRYDKLDVLYLGSLTLAMIFDAILMWTVSKTSAILRSSFLRLSAFSGSSASCFSACSRI